MFDSRVLLLLAPDPPRAHSLDGDGLPDPQKLNATRMGAGVWWCGDDVCDCTQAEIVGWDSEAGGLRQGTRRLWQGPFHSDGESGAYDELRACFQFLSATAPEVAARIDWDDEAKEAILAPLK